MRQILTAPTKSELYRNIMSKEVILNLPWDAIDSGKGLAIDIGGSVIKMLYLHKDDWVKPSDRRENSLGQLRLINFAREILNEAVSYVLKRVHIIRSTPDERTTIFTTGIGGSQFKETITSTFNVKTTSITETDCFIHSCVYLMKNLPRQDVLVELNHQAYESCRKEIIKYTAMREHQNDVSMDVVIGEDVRLELPEPRPYTTDRNKPLADEAGIFPCMVFVCGSNIGSMVINKDGSFSLTDGSYRGGKMFLGLGSLLTGVKSYNELMALAIKGNAFNVGLSNTALSDRMNRDERYPHVEETSEKEKMAFYFGHAIGKKTGDFKKEDKARCLLEMMIQDLVRFAHNASTESQVKNVFFVGGFVNHQLVRDILTTEWLYRDLGKIHFHFLKHGSHLGALGAYLNSKLHFISDTGKI